MTDREFEKLLDEVAGERATEVEMQPDALYTEREDGLTINGGAYSIAYYYDQDGNPCRKEDASKVNIVEYTENGERLNETYALITK